MGFLYFKISQVVEIEVIERYGKDREIKNQC